MAEVTVPEEFLFGISQSMEDLTSSQKEISSSIGSLNRTLDEFSDVNQDLNSAMKGLSPQALIPQELLDGIANLSGAIQNQTRSNEESSREIFDVLRPQPTTTPINPGLFSDILSGVPRFEEGGKMERAGAAVVGEAGPELLLIPEDAGVSPIDTGFFEKFSAFSENLDAQEFMKEFFGSDKLLITSTRDGQKAIPSPLPNENFEPWDITNKIEEKIKESVLIKDDFRQGIVDRRKAIDAINILEALKSMLPRLSYQQKDEYEESLKLSSSQENEINAEMSEAERGLNQILNPSLQGEGKENAGINAAQTGAEASLETEPGKNLESPTAGTTATGAETEANLIKTVGDQVGKLITPSGLSKPATPAPKAPEAPKVEQVVAQEVQQNIESTRSPKLNIPQNLSVTVTKDENGEKLLNDINDSLKQMNSLLVQMTASLSKTFIAPDSYPIRPSNKNF